jgi:hypothetical protein
MSSTNQAQQPFQSPKLFATTLVDVAYYNGTYYCVGSDTSTDTDFKVKRLRGILEERPEEIQTGLPKLFSISVTNNTICITAADRLIVTLDEFITVEHIVMPAKANCIQATAARFNPNYGTVEIFVATDNELYSYTHGSSVMTRGWNRLMNNIAIMSIACHNDLIVYVTEDGRATRLKGFSIPHDFYYIEHLLSNKGFYCQQVVASSSFFVIRQACYRGNRNRYLKLRYGEDDTEEEFNDNDVLKGDSYALAMAGSEVTGHIGIVYVDGVCKSESVTVTQAGAWSCRFLNGKFALLLVDSFILFTTKKDLEKDVCGSPAELTRTIKPVCGRDQDNDLFHFSDNKGVSLGIGSRAFDDGVAIGKGSTAIRGEIDIGSSTANSIRLGALKISIDGDDIVFSLGNKSCRMKVE